MSWLSLVRPTRRDFDGRKGRVNLLPSDELSGVDRLIACQLQWAALSPQRAGKPLLCSDRRLTRASRHLEHLDWSVLGFRLIEAKL